MFPEILPSKLSIAEYIDTIFDSEKRKYVEMMFIGANEMLVEAQSKFGGNSAQIRISNDEEFNAEGMGGIIFINSGVIDFCLAIKDIQLAGLIPELDVALAFAGSKMVGISSLSWILLHEFFHATRQHNSVIDEVGSSSCYLNAAEMDADLCAISVLYRYLQEKFSEYYDDEIIKRLAFYFAYITVRSFPNPENNQSHPDTIDRIYHIFSKMIALRKFNLDPVNQNPTPKEMQSEIVFMTKLLLALEEKFCQNNGTKSDFPEYMKNSSWKNCVGGWEDIRAVVAVKSNTKT